jgi:hypothetical protein
MAETRQRRQERTQQAVGIARIIATEANGFYRASPSGSITARLDCGISAEVLKALTRKTPAPA